MVSAAVVVKMAEGGGEVVKVKMVVVVPARFNDDDDVYICVFQNVSMFLCLLLFIKVGFSSRSSRVPSSYIRAPIKRPW